MDTKARQSRVDQVPTLTKTSGLDYRSSATPTTQKSNTPHQPVTKNDKGSN